MSFHLSRIARGAGPAAGAAISALLATPAPAATVNYVAPPGVVETVCEKADAPGRCFETWVTDAPPAILEPAAAPLTKGGPSRGHSSTRPGTRPPGHPRPDLGPGPCPLPYQTPVGLGICAPLDDPPEDRHPPAVPLPAAGLLLGFALVSGLMMRRAR